MGRSTWRRCARGSSAGSATNGFDSVDAIRGLKDATHVEHVDALFRAQYVASLTDYLPGKLVQYSAPSRRSDRVDWLRTLLETSPMTTLFLVIAAGYLVGEINVKGFALGSGAVLFVGLACGAFAPKAALPGSAGHARPAALPLLRGHSVRRRMVSRAHEPLGTEGQRRGLLRSGRRRRRSRWSSCARGAAGLPESLGMFAGATTSTPALQAVLDALGNQDAAVGYSLAYPFGVAGPILCMYVYLAIFKPTDRRASGPVDEAGRGPRAATRRSSDGLSSIFSGACRKACRRWRSAAADRTASRSRPPSSRRTM